jgi:hypothetical protein
MLPPDFNWDTEQNAVTTLVGSAGSNTFKVKYTPWWDTTNYNEVEDISVTITVSVPTGGATVTINLWTDDNTLFASASSVSLSRSASQTALITGLNGAEYSGHQWSINGSDVPASQGGNAATYTFSSLGKGNGTYYVGLQVRKNSIWYSTTITITVTN